MPDYTCFVSMCNENRDRIGDLQSHLKRAHSVKRVLEACEDCDGNNKKCNTCGGVGYHIKGRY